MTPEPHVPRWLFSLGCHHTIWIHGHRCDFAGSLWCDLWGPGYAARNVGLGSPKCGDHHRPSHCPAVHTAPFQPPHLPTPLPPCPATSRAGQKCQARRGPGSRPARDEWASGAVHPCPLAPGGAWRCFTRIPESGSKHTFPDPCTTPVILLESPCK